MYSVVGDGITIYNDIYPTESAKAVSPKLTLKDNSAGTLEITLPPGNSGYDTLERLRSELIVYRDDKEIWSGRILSEKTDFWNNRVLTCEGELAYLNDTTQPPHKYEFANNIGDENTDVRDFLAALLEIHNSKVEDDKITFGGMNKKFTLGAVTVHEKIGTAYTDNESTFSVISTQLLEVFGGHLRIRKENGVRYLDYLEDYPSTNTQQIRFGQNLIDFTRNWDATEFVTVVTPKGASQDKSAIDGLESFLDVSSVNGGSRYVTNEEGIKRFGWIEAVAEWTDITDADELLEEAKRYLSEQQFDNMVIEITAVDLRYLGVSGDAIGLLDMVRCISLPHGMDRAFPVTELSIQFDNPENSIYILNSEVTNKTTSAISHSISKLDSQPTPSQVLESAKYNATQIINSATRGVVTIMRNAKGTQSLDITSDISTYDPIEGFYSPTTRLWRWNIDGLGYSTDGGHNFKFAITSDGAIVADFITVGTMSADRIRTGVLMSQDNNVIWNLNEDDYTTDDGTIYAGGSLTIKKGSISLGESFGNWSGAFCVDEDGNIHAESGTIGGFTISSDEIYNDVLNLNNAGLDFYIDKKLLGTYGTQYWNKQPDINGMATNLEHDTGYIAWSYFQNASDDVSTIKFMYTSKELIDDKNGKFKADRLHLGTMLQLDHGGFGYSYGTANYKSVTFTRTGEETHPQPSRLKLVTNLEISNGTPKWEELICYICNGVIMIEE